MQSILAKHFPDLRMLTGVPYRELTTLGVGKDLPLLAEPSDTGELAELIKFCRKESIRYFVFGGGSNIIGMDAPYRGIGIRLAKEFSGFSEKNGVFHCGAMVRLPFLARKAAALGFCGLAPLSGIPGSLGGAVRMNAGAGNAEIGKFVRRLEGIDGCGEFWRSTGDCIDWQYRSTSIPHDVIITAVTLELVPGDSICESQRIDAELKSRREREPDGRTAGCTFRNISPSVPAGKLIDECGLKNFRQGAVGVSAKHANYIVNYGNATETEYFELLKTVRGRVYEKTGYKLHLEAVPVNPEFETALDSALAASAVL